MEKVPETLLGFQKQTPHKHMNSCQLSTGRSREKGPTHKGRGW